MKRLAIQQLIEWKNRADKKPLLLHGARQVGKTWLMKEFGSTQYENTAYIMFEKNLRMKELFSGDMDVRRLLAGLEIEVSAKINPQTTLIIFDEIQACKNALASLKFFYENAPEYHIIAAGSLLGVLVGDKDDYSFPVGKVEFMNMYPMNFYEFLTAVGEQGLCDLLNKKDFSLISAFRDKFISYLRTYFYVGGMPEPISKFINGGDFAAARKAQIEILTSYQEDFSKHIPVETLPQALKVWDSIPAQLARENKKFIYSEIQKGAKAKTYEDAITWLARSGLIYRVDRIAKPATPLKSYSNTGAFKLFVVDVGLLSAMSLLNVKTLLEGDALFTEFKGALTEQFACQELCANKVSDIAYWANKDESVKKGNGIAKASNRMSEVDFILQSENNGIIPLEVKAAANLKAKSLKVYMDKYKPVMAIRSSLVDYRKNGNLYDVPLYALFGLKEIIEESTP
jgi:predicted AAA+ superfamily ATPase